MYDFINSAYDVCNSNVLHRKHVSLEIALARGQRQIFSEVLLMLFGGRSHGGHGGHNSASEEVVSCGSGVTCNEESPENNEMGSICIP